MCFKHNTSLEMMMCDGDKKQFSEDVEEVYIAPSHVVRSIKDFDSPNNLKQQLASDTLNLPLMQNSEPVLNTFIEHKV